MTIKRPNKVVTFIKNNFLLILILLSILLGFGIGIGLKNSSLSKQDDLVWFTLPGSLFIRSLEMLIVPVVFIGVVAATSSLSAKSNLKMTLICVGLTFLTHILATICGLAGALIVNALSQTNQQSTVIAVLVEKQKTTYDIISDILRSLIPKNIIKATTNQEITKYVLNENQTYKRTIQYIEGTNILGVLVFALLIGLATSVLDEKAKLFRDFFKAANDVVILVLKWLILLAPIGIASLIIDAIIDIDDLGESFKRISLFAGVCVAVLIFYGTFVLGLMVFLFTRKNPFKYYYYFLESMLLAFASTSGAVCIHKNLDICEHKVKMDPRLSRFTIPLYTTIQADGSSIFIVMSCGFLATYQNISLSAADYAVIFIFKTLISLIFLDLKS